MIRPAVAGTNKTWFMARNLLSPRYTTKWSELRKIYQQEAAKYEEKFSAIIFRNTNNVLGSYLVAQ